MKQIAFLLITFTSTSFCTSTFGDVTNFTFIEELLTESLNEKIDPCDDFYEFACGKWMDTIDTFLNPYIYFTAESYYYFNNLFYDKYLFGKKYHNSKALETLKYGYKKCITHNLSNSSYYFNFEGIFNKCEKDFERVFMFVQNPLIIEDVIGVEKITKLYKIANRMFQIMKKNFAEIIEEKKWLDKESKENMIKKLNGIKFYDRLYDPYHNLSNVEQFFKLLVYKTDHTYENITYYTEIFSILMDAKMGTHNMPIYIEDILQPNAYYYRIDNTVHILLGYLLKPTFDPKYMTSMIFGGLGGTIGHEMLHAFDGIGMNFFLEATRGQLLSDYSQEIYLKKKQCLIDQYEKPDSKLPSLTIDGSRSYGENLSDNSGIKLAYKAYKKYEKMYGAEKNRMKKFRKYTNDQLFFISFAHSYCSVMSDYIRARKISSPRSVHLPDDIRVILSTANREEFSKAFECKVGTKMNPDDKCEIWKFKHKTL